jgi:hypothetical protein
MEIESKDLLNAAIAQALAQISTEKLATVLVEMLNEHPKNSYGTPEKTTHLEDMVIMTVKHLAQRIVEEVVQSKADVIREQLIEQLDGRIFSVTVDGYNDKLGVSITLEKPKEAS